MAKASDNLFPKVLLAEGAAPASPAAGNQGLFIDSADHKLKRVNSSGAVTTIEGGGASGALKGFATAKLGANASIPASSTYVDVVSGTFDLTVPAAAGDLLEARFAGRVTVGSTGIWAIFDPQTIVSGAAVNSFLNDGAISTTVSDPSWGRANLPSDANGWLFSGSKFYVAAAGDLSGGNVTVRLRVRCGGALTVVGGTDPYARFVLLNHGAKP